MPLHFNRKENKEQEDEAKKLSKCLGCGVKKLIGKIVCSYCDWNRKDIVPLMRFQGSFQEWLDQPKKGRKKAVEKRKDIT